MKKNNEAREQYEAQVMGLITMIDKPKYPITATQIKTIKEHVVTVASSITNEADLATLRHLYTEYYKLYSNQAKVKAFVYKAQQKERAIKQEEAQKLQYVTAFTAKMAKVALAPKKQYTSPFLAAMKNNTPTDEEGIRKASLELNAE